MSRSGSGKLDPNLEGMELLFHQKGGSASFGAKHNGVDLGCMNPITDPLVEQSAQISCMIKDLGKLAKGSSKTITISIH
jgi:hypothetical protein